MLRFKSQEKLVKAYEDKLRQQRKKRNAKKIAKWIKKRQGKLWR